MKKKVIFKLKQIKIFWLTEKQLRLTTARHSVLRIENETRKINEKFLFFQITDIVFCEAQFPKTAYSICSLVVLKNLKRLVAIYL